MERFLLTALLAIAFLAVDGVGQGTTQISRRCPGASPSPARATVTVERDGDVVLTPCNGRTVSTTSTGAVTNTGGVVVNNFTSETTNTSGAVTFNSPSMVLGNDAEATVNINSAVTDGIRIGHSNATLGGQILVSSVSSNSWAVPSTMSLQLGATAGGNPARIDLSRSTSTVSVFASTLDLGNGSNAPATIKLRRTVTAAGTTGAQTINLANGTINFAAAAATITVTNSTVSATSLIVVTPQRLDATCQVFAVDAKGAGTFNIVATAACTAETSVAFWVFN